MPRQASGVYRNCEACKGRFYVCPSAIRRGQGRFCSKRCFDATQDRKVERTCEMCGKTIRVSPSYAAKGQYRACSAACRIKLRQLPLAEAFRRNCGEPTERGCIPWVGCRRPDGYGMLGHLPVAWRGIWRFLQRHRARHQGGCLGACVFTIRHGRRGLARRRTRRLTAGPSPCRFPPGPARNPRAGSAPPSAAVARAPCGSA